MAHPSKATIVGAGPVACLVAIELRKRSFQVELYEREADPRQVAQDRPGIVTLTRRGLNCLDAELAKALCDNSVALPQRVVHQADGSLSHHRYGTSPEHPPLAISRGLLHRTLLDAAEKAGARLLFDHGCISVDPGRARAAYTVRGGIHETTADLLIGCDGADSVVRHEMSRHGARKHIEQDHSTNGFIELSVPPAPTDEHAVLPAQSAQRCPVSLDHALHVWPRGDRMLVAQPNVDNAYAVGLFLPWDGDQPSWESMRTPHNVEMLFARYFPGIRELFPRLSAEVHTATPRSAKTVQCFPYHHGRTVLIGDSSQTLAPLYGLGINWSFEDVKTFFDIFDQHRDAGDPEACIPRALGHFTAVRKPHHDAIAKLAQKLGAELTDATTVGTETDRPVRTPRSRGRECSTEPVRNGVSALAATPSGSDLDLAPEQRRALLDAVTGRLLTYQDDLAQGRYPAAYLQDHGAKGVDAQLREPEVPELGTSLDGLLDDIFDKAITSGMVHAHPGFLADSSSGSLFQAAVGEFIARTLNRFPGSWASTPGLAQIESNVIRWFCGMLGYPDRAFGYLTTSGSLANLMALHCALVQGGDVARQRATVYVSSQGHFSVEKAARIAGLSQVQVRVINTYHSDYSMNIEELCQRVEQDRREGFFPACVVATAGTANTGAIDDLARLADFCLAQNIWLHADACLGGFFRITARGKAMLEGIEHADSIAVDAHKSLFLPHGTSALLVKESARLRAAFEVPGAAYVPQLAHNDDQVDFCNYGPEYTREVRGLAAWLPIKMHGIKAFEQRLDEKLDLADHLADSLRGMDGVDVVRRESPHLPTVAFKLRSDNRIEEERLNERLCELVCTRGNVYVGTARLPQEGLVIRACILHHQTDKVIVDQLVEDIAMSIDAL